MTDHPTMPDPSGGPAFPQTQGENNDWPGHYGLGGMTLRDWFAGQALAGVCAGPEFNGDIAALCYEMADAMLTERESRRHRAEERDE